MNMLYTQSARFDTGHALTEDELFKLAPSVFATDAHHSRSERFAPVPTIDMVRGLRNEGFCVVGAKQAVARVDDKRNYTKHMLRIRHIDDMRHHKVGDTVAEMYLKNANDGTCAYELMAGLFRIQCLNSLVAQTDTIDSIKVYHKGRALEQVIEGTYRVIGESQKLLDNRERWGDLQLNHGQRNAFAEAAHVLRFDLQNESDAARETHAIKPTALLSPRRFDDQGTDLWTTLNVVQENCMRGGLTGIGRDANNRRRRTTTREVKGIDQDVKLNKALWVLTERMAQLVA